MNKKRNFAKTALLGVLLCGLAGPTFVGCKDYDDDIDGLQDHKAIHPKVQFLQNSVFCSYLK